MATFTTSQIPANKKADPWQYVSRGKNEWPTFNDAWPLSSMKKKRNKWVFIYGLVERKRFDSTHRLLIEFDSACAPLRSLIVPRIGVNEDISSDLLSSFLFSLGRIGETNVFFAKLQQLQRKQQKIRDRQSKNSMSLVRRDFKAATASGCVYKSGGVEDGTSLHVTLNGWDVALFLPLSLTLCPLEWMTCERPHARSQTANASRLNRHTHTVEKVGGGGEVCICLKV